MSLGHCLLSIIKCTLRSLVDISSREAQKHFQLFQLHDRYFARLCIATS